LVVLDEIQRLPSLFELLRVLADRPRTPARFLLLGSASPRLVKGVSETLAGRVAFIEMGGFGLREAGEKHYRRLWLRGGFPRAFMASGESASLTWRQNSAERKRKSRAVFAHGVPGRRYTCLWPLLS
jgi:predicted AAA+ superfamily ATPase